MSKGIVLAVLLIILSTERKLRLPLDMSKQTKVCRVWFIQRMSAIQTALRILMSSVGIIIILFLLENVISPWFAREMKSMKILKREGQVSQT